MNSPHLSSSLKAVALLAGLGLALSAFAGPGPQYWNKKGNPQAPDPSAKPAPACPGCKTTVLWREGSRTPSGRGAPTSIAIGQKHECAMCSGALVTQNGTVKNEMKHAANCGPMACCK